MDRFRFLGVAREGESWTCGFAPLPGDPHCDAPAALHGVTLTDDCTEIIAAMMCCDAHRPALELSADLIHPLGSACGLPGSDIWWDQGVSGCRLRWASTAALAVEHAVG